MPVVKSPPDAPSKCPAERPNLHCPVSVEYLQQKLKERQERMQSAEECAVPVIPPPPPKRDHKKDICRVELKNY